MNFGTNLRNLRITRGLTQQKLAKDMEMSQASITAYETGTREPNFNVIKRFSEYFHVPPSQLMPFGDVSDDEEIYRKAEALHSNKKLCLLFDKTRNMNESDLDAILVVVNAIAKERGE